MPIDPNIPLQAKNPQIETGINQLASVGEAMKIGEMQRGIGVQNELRKLYSQGIDVGTPEGFKQVAALDPATALKLRADALQGRKLEGDITKTGFEIDKQKMDLFRERIGNLAFNPSNANIQAHLEDSVKRGEITPQVAQQQFAQATAVPIDKRSDYFTQMGMKVEQRVTAAEQLRHNRATEGIQGGHLDVARQNLAAQNNPDLQGTLAAAKASGTTKGKAIATAELNLPGAIATGQELERKIYEMVGKPPVYKDGKLVQAGTAPHAGFKGAVGMGSWKTLGIPGVEQLMPGSAASDFKARFDEVMGGAFEEAYNTLKGGGSITEKEGEKATAAKTRMRLAQSEQEFITAAREYAGVVNKGIERAKTKAAGGSANPAASGEIDFNSLK